MKTGFTSTLNKGFRMTFENNISISVQFGYGNYCTNRNAEILSNPLKHELIESLSAEIAIIDEISGKWFNFGNDEVKGYCTPDEVAKWISKVSKAKSIDKIRK